GGEAAIAVTDASPLAAVTLTFGGELVASFTAPPYAATIVVPATATTDAEGRYVFAVEDFGATLTATVPPSPTDPSGEPGATAVERVVAIEPGSGTLPVDARLTPLAAPVAIATTGGAIQAGLLAVSFAAGAVPAGTSARLTPLSPQGLPNLLPLGWSPLLAFDLRATNSGGGAVAAAPGSVTAALSGLEESPLALVRYDGDAHAWTVAEIDLVPVAGALTVPLDEFGAHAMIVADDVVAPGAEAPPLPLPGDELEGVAAGIALPADAATPAAEVDRLLLEPGGGFATDAVVNTIALFDGTGEALRLTDLEVGDYAAGGLARTLVLVTSRSPESGLAVVDPFASDVLWQDELAGDGGTLARGAALAIGRVGADDLALVAGEGTADRDGDGIADHAGGVLAVVDMADPLAPLVTAIHPLDHPGGDVVLSGTTAVVSAAPGWRDEAGNRGAVTLVDLSDPALPETVGTLAGVGSRLARDHGAMPIARALRADDKRLRSLLRAGAESPAPASPPFVEVCLAAPDAFMCVVEMARQDGAAMTIRLSRDCAAALGTLSEVFFGGGAMIQLTPQMCILMALEPVDFRRRPNVRFRPLNFFPPQASALRGAIHPTSCASPGTHRQRRQLAVLPRPLARSGHFLTSISLLRHGLTSLHQANLALVAQLVGSSRPNAGPGLIGPKMIRPDYLPRPPGATTGRDKSPPCVAASGVNHIPPAPEIGAEAGGWRLQAELRVDVG
ncbi:MAG: hypothetical protein HYV63_34830, partial [Candidatus Schekmanbacteria bacterium]|nr:hypothetical protein [Candidatus Schekmanbacteria bacterium]